MLLGLLQEPVQRIVDVARLVLLYSCLIGDVAVLNYEEDDPSARVPSRPCSGTRGFGCDSSARVATVSEF